MAHSTALDGATFDSHAVRFTGTIKDIGDEEIAQSGLDDVGIWVLVTHSGGVAVKPAKDGTVTRVNVLKATDIRVLPKDVRELLITKLDLSLED
jgi:hypothetical protein